MKLPIHSRAWLGAAVLLLLCSGAARAQTTYSDDFTGATTTNQWNFFNGACLTAGTTSVTGAGTVAGGLGQGTTDSNGNPAYTFPGCLSIAGSYYNETLVGGSMGYLGSTSAPSTPTGGMPDAAGSGALRFTNGHPGGYQQRGAIVSASTFPTNQGVEVTFKSVTYEGDSGGSGGDGADGISFFLMDGSQPPGLGATGGSLAYSCSNSNTPYDGLVGAYLGVGIDEFGNFLNGTTNTLGTSTAASGDNTASGGGYQWNRIGVRGAGSVAWAALTGAYGTNPSSSTLPYYPSTLATTCTNGGVLTGGICTVYTCSSGTLSGTNCVTTTYSCTKGTYNSSTGKCSKEGTVETNTSTAAATANTGAAYSEPYSLLAVQNTCASGKLWNYSTPSAPTSAGPTSLSTVNAGNTANILDYQALGYSLLPTSGTTAVQIAAESATTRGAATPIFYDLKITPDGLLSLSYSISGAAYQPVITNESITASNGPLPSSFRFGFAGSTGGDTNIHELMCFKATPNSESGGSTSVNQKQSSKIESTTQAYFGYYNPTDWTGDLTANYLIDTAGVVTVAAAANWSSSCVLTGVASGGTCAKTGVAGPTAAQSPTSRVMLTWNGTAGIPFEWSSLTTAQQNALDADDATPDTANRLNYLRGVRDNEVNNSGTGLQLYRDRDSVLSDIVDSSPVWVGPPDSPYTATWQDRLYPMAATPENSTQTYLQFISADQERQNVVYVGANDGFLHGFRSGSFDGSGNFVNNATTPNDGAEVLAYMPADVLQTIHNTTSNALDFSNPQYGHNFYADATPGTGDLFYGGAWHTWLVSGLGAGGAELFALDITNTSATSFTESSASSLVIGDWDAASISCTNVSGCGANLGDTYGTPQIRRLHNGDWGVIFGNGFGSSSGDAGIYVMTIDQTSGARTFYYLSTGQSGGDGIAYVTPVDLDGDHVTDYVYAGDLHGNVWRFDLTNSDPTKWVAGAAPLFTTQAGQPITSQLVVASVPVTGVAAPLVVVAFGTGQRTQLTNTTPTAYASGGQDLYGVWDWNMSAWNMESPTQYQSLASSPTLTYSNLTPQTLTYNSTSMAWDDTNTTICWDGMTLCSTGNNQFGWYLALPGTSGTGTYEQYEQIVYNPTLYQSTFIVDSTLPASNIPTSCSDNLDSGNTYAISIATGGAFTSIFPQYHDTAAAGVPTSATGTPYVVQTVEGTTALIYQTVGGTPGSTQFNPPSNVKVNRLTWVELR